MTTKRQAGRPRKHTEALERTTLRLPRELLKAARIYGIQHDLDSFNDVVVLALRRLVGGR